MLDDLFFNLNEGDEIDYETDMTGHPYDALEGKIDHQTLVLKAGWNLLSFYVEADDMTPAKVLDPLISAKALVQIKNLTTSYAPSLPFFLNTMTSLNVNDGYWVEVTEDVAFEIEGNVPDKVLIPVKAGWNLVGYPSEKSDATPTDALTSLNNTVEQIKTLTH